MQNAKVKVAVIQAIFHQYQQRFSFDMSLVASR